MNQFDVVSGRAKEAKINRRKTSLFNNIVSGRPILLSHYEFKNMTPLEFNMLICGISNDKMAELILHRIENPRFDYIFRVLRDRAAKNVEDDLCKDALVRIKIFENLFKEMIQENIKQNETVGRVSDQPAPETMIKNETIKHPESKIDEAERHIFMQTMKIDYNPAYRAVKKGLETGIIEFKDNCFNFKCNNGCVGLLFKEAGYTEYKHISRHIKINGKNPGENTLKNCTKNTPPKEWEKIKQIIFIQPPKQPLK